MTLCKGEDSIRHRLSGLIRGHQHGSEGRCDAMTARWPAPFCHCDDCQAGLLYLPRTLEVHDLSSRPLSLLACASRTGSRYWNLGRIRSWGLQLPWRYKC